LFSLTITHIIIVITAIISVIAFSNHQVFDKLKFNAFIIFHRKEVWRFFTSSLLHADFLHLFMNMYVLFMFGNAVEVYFAFYFPEQYKHILFYGMLYIGGAVLSSLYSFEKHKHNLWYNAVGASGAVSAVVFAFIAMEPLQSLQLIFLPGINIPAFIMGFLYMGYSWYMSRKGTDNIGHDAHLFGAIFGFIFVFIIKPELFPRFISTIILYIQHWL
jgi:membrane associated rhomboid family serine protease